MLRKSRRITIKGVLNHGVLIAEHRGFVVINPERYADNVLAFWVIEPFNGKYFIHKMLIPDGWGKPNG